MIKNAITLAKFLFIFMYNNTMNLYKYLIKSDSMNIQQSLDLNLTWVWI